MLAGWNRLEWLGQEKRKEIVSRENRRAAKKRSSVYWGPQIT